MSEDYQILNEKYEIYPSIVKRDVLNSWINKCKMVYNSALLDRTNVYKREKRPLTYNQQSKQLTKDKKVYSFLREVPSQPLQESLRRVQTSFDKFFRKEAGYPKIKLHKEYNSITFTQFGVKKYKDKNGVPRTSHYAVSLTEKNNLRISKLGEVPVNWHRPLEGKVKQVTIKRQGSRWFAIFSVERQVAKEELDINNAVGIDVGLNTFAFLSNGDKEENPRFLRESEKKLKKAQRKLSRMRRGSSNYKKQVHKLQKIHEKVANQRKDFLHKLSYKLSKMYSVICIEKLNIRNMVRNRRLSKSIHDVGWGMFRNFLNYKCFREGGRLIQVEPKYTTQDCSNCDNRVKKSLSVRTHVCDSCGLVLDRDCNAAINILNKGLAEI